MKLLVTNAKQVVRVTANGEKMLRGLEQTQSSLAILTERNGEGISILIDEDGKIAAIDYDSKIQNLIGNIKIKNVIDATGMCIIPGLVDGHTHPVWAGDRVHEFVMKMSGATYMEVHAAGGGIHFTVDKTRDASEEELFLLLSERLRKMMRNGTVLVEAKSGYGLDLETEIKMLKVIEKAKNCLPLSISSTFCGAHAVPKGKTASEATKDIIENQLPEVIRLRNSKAISVDSIDVFCEKGVFEIEESRAILNAGRKTGLRLNFHADELAPIGGAEMGASLGAEAMSHLEEISPAGIELMQKANSFAVLLPTTVIALRLKSPPVRSMINAGVAIALGTDFNPNAHCLSMPMVMYLACSVFGMSPTEALIGATINSAAALGYERTHGSLEIGKNGDFVIIDATRWENIIYQLGGERDVIKSVIIKGDVIYTKTEAEEVQL
ncbi:probable imidazolonepropionase [Artemia franciscana]|uniref:Probable imidazolonepropionase n=1 Tax=Artemia franciscana TaxID=6661 RepID=A0AA88LLM7_ARTSF|nr:hypothetical protein QYM36_008529 [Artemia franciscana]KAK2728082.1 hypothetical protein QYM36_008529 [Artemia franciscana]